MKRKKKYRSADLKLDKWRLEGAPLRRSIFILDKAPSNRYYMTCLWGHYTRTDQNELSSVTRILYSALAPEVEACEVFLCLGNPEAKDN